MFSCNLPLCLLSLLDLDLKSYSKRWDPGLTLVEISFPILRHVLTSGVSTSFSFSSIQCLTTYLVIMMEKFALWWKEQVGRR